MQRPVLLAADPQTAAAVVDYAHIPQAIATIVDRVPEGAPMDGLFFVASSPCPLAAPVPYFFLDAPLSFRGHGLTVVFARACRECRGVKMIQVQLRAQTLAELQHSYRELSPELQQVGVDDRGGVAEERYGTSDVISASISLFPLDWALHLCIFGCRLLQDSP